MGSDNKSINLTSSVVSGFATNGIVTRQCILRSDVLEGRVLRPCVAQIASVMAALMAAREEDEARGGGAADARRWTALRNTVEARAMLKTVFRAAAAHAAQVPIRSIDLITGQQSTLR